jgi:hypothetical protein
MPRQTFQEFVASLDGVRLNRDRRSGIAKCPAHDDRQASLSFRQSDTGRLLAHCFAGCPFVEIVRAARFSDIRREALSGGR